MAYARKDDTTMIIKNEKKNYKLLTNLYPYYYGEQHEH